MKLKKLFPLALILIVSVVLGLSLASSPSVLAANQGGEEVGSPRLPNPLGGNADLMTVLLRVMQIALALVDIFALFMFILGGFEFLISAGNPNMIKRAKDTLIWATIGIVVITLSYSILKFIFEAVQKGVS
jgi:hypothetical protein